MSAWTWIVGAAAILMSILATEERRKGEKVGDPAFSESYWEAREKFRRGVAGVAGMELHTLPLWEGSEYTIDVGLYWAGPKPWEGGEVVIHLSGVHGVEGYAGSAIQVKQLGKWSSSPPTKNVVMVHAFNPYGMAHFRRWNENNVDLNRNAIFSKEKWAELKSRGFNVAGYGDFDSLFNPPHAPSHYSAFSVFVQAVLKLAEHGLPVMKRALVAAQYEKPTGIFFGGFETQASYILFKSFLEAHNIHKATGKVTLIDVHTGLGPIGVDSLLVRDQAMKERIQKRFPISPVTDPLTQVEAMDGSDVTAADAGAGYELTEGTTDVLIPQLFPETKDFDLVTQEFGTLTGVLVARSLILENMAFHYDKEHQPYWSEYTRDAFYVRTPEWKRAILRRGLEMLRQSQM
eukprot:TRINITY_DN5828_c0_g1_i1.p1 TRINITY_DN5828_c0_g1~~TRINITY_DN5828_c0_g1_i1.p1  ORF type:complete len:403 (+),score=89.13 TRINITY_DN5828_c0_g1_i1:57-1265(+)